MKKVFSIIMSAIMLIATLSACSDDTKKQSTSSEKTSEGSKVDLVNNDNQDTSSGPLKVTLVGDNIIKVELTTPLANDVIQNDKYRIVANFMWKDSQEGGNPLFQIEANNDGFMTYTAMIFKATSVENILTEYAFANSDSENYKAESEHIKGEISPDKIVWEFTYNNIAEHLSHAFFVDISLQKPDSREDILISEWDISKASKVESQPAQTTDESNENKDNNSDTLTMVGNIYKQSNGATMEIVHSNSEGCITAVKFDDILLEMTNAQCGTDGSDNGKWYSGEFNGGIFSFNAIYSVSEDSFNEVWFSVGAGDGTQTRMEFDDQRFMGAYTLQSAKPNSARDTSFLGKEYTYRADFGDGTFKDHTITLTKVDADGNLTELKYDGYTINLTNSTSEYFGDYVKFSGNCPGHFIEIVFTYEYSQSGQNPPDTVYLTTGWGEGRDENMPLIIDGTFTR